MDSIQTKNKYNWHAVYLKYRSEKKVNDELLRKGIECYLPLRISKRIWSDRFKIISEPILSSYIFVKVSQLEYYDVLVTNGALKYVCFENKPAIITDREIELLKAFVNNFNDEIEVVYGRIDKGNFVKIINGPLKNLIAEVVETRGKSNLVLRFGQLGYTLQVDLGQNEVEVVTEDTRIKFSA